MNFMKTSLKPFLPFKRQPDKMVTHIQIICRLFVADELRVYLTILWGWRLKG